MTFDPKMDKVLGKWECGLLEVSVRQYGTGEPKLQIGPRFYDSKDGTRKASKCGRLTAEEAAWLAIALEQAKEFLET